jgi:hypothetical protein
MRPAVNRRELNCSLEFTQGGQHIVDRYPTFFWILPKFLNGSDRSGIAGPTCEDRLLLSSREIRMANHVARFAEGLRGVEKLIEVQFRTIINREVSLSVHASILQGAWGSPAI